MSTQTPKVNVIYPGQRFGRLEVLRIGEKVGLGNAWVCQCDCGKQKTIREFNLKCKKGSKSCGCLAIEKSLAVNTTHGHTSGKNKNRRSIEYSSWNSAISRCHRPNSTGFHNYGGRGIQVCDRWRFSFSNFYEDMGPRPSLKHTLDRIDNDKNYEPGNCKWSTKSEQALNSRRNKLIEINGEKIPLTLLARMAGIPVDRLRGRIKRGIKVEIAIMDGFLNQERL